MIHLNNKHSNEKFPTNYIRTTKYTVYNFVFLALAYQYLRFSNCYFLLILVLSCTDISPISEINSILPVIFVLTVSLIREAIEDHVRYKQDKESNSK
jgi:diacylglycerol kinase